MLFKIEENSALGRHANTTLKNIQISEKQFQEMLFNNDVLIPEREFIKLMQSKVGEAEPDLMALGEDGTLYIFELKKWEGKEEDLLQVLRYGQRYGRYSYEELNSLYQESLYERDKESLSREEIVKKESIEKRWISSFNADGTNNDDDAKRFDISTINHRQVFVLVTNGIDAKTKDAAQYWQAQGLNIIIWTYNVYSPNKDKQNKDNLIEMIPFGGESPYLVEGGNNYFILNTNIKDGLSSQEDMLLNKKASTYTYPWTDLIKKTRPGDTIFLYQSGKGIIAKGQVFEKPRYANLNSGQLETFVQLKNFSEFTETPISARELKQVIDKNIILRSTMITLDYDSGKLLDKHINEQVKVPQLV